MIPSLNEYIDAERSSKYKGAEFKKKWERIVILHAKKALKGWKATGPVCIRYRFFEKDRRRDYDNIQGLAHKIIQDALVKGKWLPNDGQKWVMPPESEFFIDKDNPRVEVEISEIFQEKNRRRT